MGTSKQRTEIVFAQPEDLDLLYTAFGTVQYQIHKRLPFAQASEDSSTRSIIHEATMGLTGFPRSKKELADRINDNIFLLAKRDDEIIGFLEARFGGFSNISELIGGEAFDWQSCEEYRYFNNPKSLSHIAYMDRIAIAKKYRREGVATALENRLKTRLQSNGVKIILTDILIKPSLNLTSLQFHTQHMSWNRNPLAYVQKTYEIEGIHQTFEFIILAWNL